MGIGDELMRAGEAGRRAKLAPGSRYRMLDKNGNPMWHFVWDGNPHVAKPGEHCDGSIGFTNGVRDYIESHTKEQYTFREYQPSPAYLPPHLISSALAERAAGAIVFNPTIKDRAPPNKQWDVGNWKSLVTNSPYRWVRIGENVGGRRFGFGDFVQTISFWDAVSVMSGARAVVCHEGALHHAAAALGVPCVVLRGGFISPRVTGYEGQVDIYVEDARYPLGCGMRGECEHCKRAMASITTGRVLAALRVALEEKAAA